MINKSMDMATNILFYSPTFQVDEDYINMELSSSPIFISYHNSRDFFEYKMPSTFQEEEPTTSPTDDQLFYNGQLQPLHLPLRLQMVQKILQNTTTIEFISNQECSLENSNNAPLESCNFSPSESGRVSLELDPDEYFFEWSSEINGFIRNRTNKNWITKHLKKSICQKLKFAGAYLKSLFRTCSNYCAKASQDQMEQVSPSVTISNGKEFSSNKYGNVSTNSLFGRTDHEERHEAINSHTTLRSIEKQMVDKDGFIHQRRSFNGVIRWHSGTDSLSPSPTSISSSGSSSSSSSLSSVSFRSNGLKFHKRSSSANSELEISIDEAIAHCKNSYLLLSSGKTASDFDQILTLLVRTDQQLNEETLLCSL